MVGSCAKEVQPERRDFPWGAWLALALPEKVDSWGWRLARVGATADIELLRAMARYDGDDEIWQDCHRRDCSRAIALLEAASISWELAGGKTKPVMSKGRI